MLASERSMKVVCQWTTGHYWERCRGTTKTLDFQSFLDARRKYLVRDGRTTYHVRYNLASSTQHLRRFPFGIATCVLGRDGSVICHPLHQLAIAYCFSAVHFAEYAQGSSAKINVRQCGNTALMQIVAL